MKVRRLRSGRRSTKEAVSEVIANVIILGLVVVLFSVIFYYVATLPTPTENQKLTFDMTFQSSNEFQFGSNVYLNITHTGGRSLNSISTLVSVRIDTAPGVMFSLPQGAIIDGNWEIGEAWRLVTTNNGASVLNTIVTPSSIAYISIVNPQSSSVLWNGQVFPRINALGPIIMGGTDPMPVPPDATFTIWARIVEVEGQGVANVTFTSPALGHPTMTNMTYNFAKDRWEYYPGVVLPAGRYSFTVYAWDTQGKPSSKTIYFVVGQASSAGPDLEVRDEYIMFSDDAPIHGSTITIEAVIFNIGSAPIGANVTFYLDDYNTTLGIIGYYNVTSIAAGGGETAEIGWRATPGGQHTIWVRATGYPNPLADLNPANNIDSKRITVLPRILLVDDDQEVDSSPYSSANYMKAALYATDFSYDIFVTGSGTGPDYDSGNTKLRDYDVVIWMTGRTTSNTLTCDQPVTNEDDVGHLTQFLNGGGRLWLIGDGVMNEAQVQARLSNFIITYMGARLVSIDTGLPNPIATPTPPPPHALWKNQVITFATSPKWADGTDRINATVNSPLNSVIVNPANPAAAYGVNKSAKVGILEYRTVFFSFNFPFVADTGDQAQITYFVMLWLSGLDKRLGRDLSVSSLVINPIRPRFMQNVLVNYTIRNNGAQAETTFEILITDTYNGVETPLITIPFIGVIQPYGGTSIQSYTWIPDKLGLHRIRVIVDWNNMIPETNEENNEISSFLTTGDVFVGYNVLLVDDDGNEGTTIGLANYNSTMSVIEDIEFMNDVHTNGLVASYRMERRYLPVDAALDSSGYRQHGTLYGGALLAYSAGKFGGMGLSLDGSNDYMRVEDSARLNPGTGLTLDAWVRTTAASGRLIDKWSIAGTAWTRSYLLSMGDSGAGKPRFAVYTSAGASAVVDGKVAINDGGWHHVAATDDGLVLSIYIDGMLDSILIQGSHTINVGTHPLIVGWSGSNIEGGYLAGSMDTVRVYSRALSASEVLKRYTYTEARDPFEYDYKKVLTGLSGPNSNVLTKYNTVIWDSGISSSQVLTKADRENVSLYLQRTDPFATFYLVAPNVVADINATANPDKTLYINFMCTAFGADLTSALVGGGKPGTVYGTFNDPISHGMSLTVSSSLGSGSASYSPKRAPKCSTPGDPTNATLHAGAADSYWTTSSSSYYGFRHVSSSFKYKTSFVMLDPAYISSNLNLVTPRGEFTNMVLHWFGAPDPRPNPRITAPDIYVSTNYGSPLSNSVIELSKGYLLKVRIRNTGMAQVSGLSLRFMDGTAIVGTATTSIDAAKYSGNDIVDGVTVVETLWSPLFAGIENISVILDPSYMSTERTRVDDNAYQSAIVYFFYDDVESGTGKWKHEAVLARINGEGPLDILPAGVTANTDITGNWDEAMSSGWEKVTSTYHSQNASYFLKETPAYPLDVFLILDNGPPMHQANNWWFAQTAAKTFIGMMRRQDRVGLISFFHETGGTCGTAAGSGSARDPCVLRPLTATSVGGKASLNASVDAIPADGGSQTPLIDAVWIGGRELIINNPWTSNRTQVIIVLGGSPTNKDDLDPPNGACCGSNGDQSDWNGLNANSGIRKMPIPVYSVWAGSSNSPLFYGISNTSDGGAYYRAATMSDLPSIFAQIALILLGGVQTLSPGEDHQIDSIGPSDGIMVGARPRNRWLVTPEISLVGYSQARLTFWQRYKMIPGQNGGLIQAGVRTNDCPDGVGMCPDNPVIGGKSVKREFDGIHWEYINPITPYNSNLNISRVTDESNATYTDQYYLKDEDGKEMLYAWSGTSTKGTFGWEYAEVDLNRYVGHSVRLNFSMFQFNAGTNDGWWLDDVVLIVTRSDADPVLNTKDQWALVCGTFAGRTTCAWRNQDTGGTNLVKGGLDNYLVSAPIDLTKARTAYLLYDVMYNVNSKAGLPPDAFRVEISSDGGWTWKPINLGVRIDAGYSGGAGGTPAWIPSTSLTRYERNISGWAGHVITVRFRMVTTTEAGYAHRDAASTCNVATTAWCGGVWLDNIRVYGESVKKGDISDGTTLSPGANDGNGNRIGISKGSQGRLSTTCCGGGPGSPALLLGQTTNARSAACCGGPQAAYRTCRPEGLKPSRYPRCT